MSQWIGFTNQKLYQCRLLLAQRSAADGGALIKALEEGATHLLHDAWLSYLQELGEMVAYRQPVSSLEQLMTSCPLPTGEMRELAQLAENSFSWLAQMLNGIAALSRPDTVRQQAASNGIGLISLTDTSDSTQVDDWFRSLQGLIDLQRENRQES
ncbi:DUF6586 family protein [Thalassolituus marinus]|uniref:Uncharacterized protein n=1 Tax=Thalassolituus marinus TaxID=671053 RepID=A0ABS7ZNF7_9GAMM|nr:DUF6586 family protein [Thalassolituus marinus]MCA6063144.1 hypothetical protein [Thalassolituus marinus]